MNDKSKLDFLFYLSVTPKANLTAEEKDLAARFAARYMRKTERVRRIDSLPVPENMPTPTEPIQPPVPAFEGTVKTLNDDGTITVSLDTAIEMDANGYIVAAKEITVPQEWVEKVPVPTEPPPTTTA